LAVFEVVNDFGKVNRLVLIPKQVWKKEEKFGEHPPGRDISHIFFCRDCGRSSKASNEFE
jgi:hypothetical protein